MKSNPTFNEFIVQTDTETTDPIVCACARDICEMYVQCPIGRALESTSCRILQTNTTYYLDKLDLYRQSFCVLPIVPENVDSDVPLQEICAKIAGAMQVCKYNRQAKREIQKS